MILGKTYFILIVLFLMSITSTYGQKNMHCDLNEITDFIKITQNESVEIFQGWNIWKRSDGFVFDYLDIEYRLLIINDDKEEVLFKEIFPVQDSVFYPMNQIDSRSGYYSFEVNNFNDKVLLFEKLKVDRVKSEIEDGLIMFVNEDFIIIFSQKGTDIRALNKYDEYSRYDKHWWYYLKD